MNDSFQKDALSFLNLLYASGIRLTRNNADAEELVQETYLKAFQHSEQFEPGSNLKAWLLRIQYNTFVNRYRKQKREVFLEEKIQNTDNQAHTFSLNQTAKLTHALSEAHQSIVSREIMEVFEELPEEQQQIVWLADVEEFSYKEISEILGCPIGTVMSRLHRARGVLQNRLINQAIFMGIVADTQDEIPSSEPISISDWKNKKVSVKS